MNVGIDKTFLNLNLARKLLIMVKNVGSKNKRGRLMKNMKSPNSGLIYWADSTVDTPRGRAQKFTIMITIVTCI